MTFRETAVVHHAGRGQGLYSLLCLPEPESHPLSSSSFVYSNQRSHLLDHSISGLPVTQPACRTLHFRPDTFPKDLLSRPPSSHCSPPTLIQDVARAAVTSMRLRKSRSNRYACPVLAMAGRVACLKLPFCLLPTRSKGVVTERADGGNLRSAGKPTLSMPHTGKSETEDEINSSAV